jgi:hypothetical protein
MSDLVTFNPVLVDDQCFGKQEYKVVYTVSDCGDLIPAVLKSIKSLERFVQKENVIVFYTPPRSKENYSKLSEIAEVKAVENITTPFDMHGCDEKGFLKGAQRYGEKLHLCEVDCPNVIFLDADTVVKKDITLLLDGDFDFSALPPKIYSKFNKDIMKAVFRNIGTEPIPMFNCGFLIFKNYLHFKIKDAWLKYTEDETLSDPQFITKEQWALSLALSRVGAKIKCMTFEQHALMWRGKTHADTFVLHGRNPLIYRRFRFWVGRHRRRIQKLLKVIA